MTPSTPRPGTILRPGRARCWPGPKRREVPSREPDPVVLWAKEVITGPRPTGHPRLCITRKSVKSIDDGGHNMCMCVCVCSCSQFVSYELKPYSHVIEIELKKEQKVRIELENL